jgi:acid phosphatase
MDHSDVGSSAHPPFYPNADKSPSVYVIAQLEGSDPKGTRLKALDSSPASALAGPPRFGASSLSPDFWAVNTMGPAYSPGMTFDGQHPELADEKDPSTLPPQIHAHIGDRLDAKGIEWAWYAGGWSVALEGEGKRADR